MAIVGNIASPDRGLLRDEAFGRAFVYLRLLSDDDGPERRRLMSLSAGESVRVELGGGVFAMEQSYLTKERGEGQLEAHRKYIDAQAVIEGEELVQTAPLDGLTVAQPYHADKDVGFYHDARETADHILKAGMYAVFYPEDAHKPCLTHERHTQVFKTVVKIPVG